MWKNWGCWEGAKMNKEQGLYFAVIMSNDMSSLNLGYYPNHFSLVGYRDSEIEVLDYLIDRLSIRRRTLLGEQDF